MFEINKAVKKALAEKGIDVQNEYNKATNERVCIISIPPNKGSKRNYLHKGILHKDHIIQKSTGKENNE
jgi:hypothetical protein